MRHQRRILRGNVSCAQFRRCVALLTPPNNPHVNLFSATSVMSASPPLPQKKNKNKKKRTDTRHEITSPLTHTITASMQNVNPLAKLFIFISFLSTSLPPLLHRIDSMGATVSVLTFPSPNPLAQALLTQNSRTRDRYIEQRFLVTETSITGPLPLATSSIRSPTPSPAILA